MGLERAIEFAPVSSGPQLEAKRPTLEAFCQSQMRQGLPILYARIQHRHQEAARGSRAAIYDCDKDHSARTEQR